MKYVCVDCSLSVETTKPLANVVCPKCKGDLMQVPDAGPTEPNPFAERPAWMKQGQGTRYTMSEPTGARTCAKVCVVFALLSGVAFVLMLLCVIANAAQGDTAGARLAAIVGGACLTEAIAAWWFGSHLSISIDILEAVRRLQR